jgi:hypothetical protein
MQHMFRDQDGGSMLTECSYRTVVSSYESTRRHNPEDQHCHPISELDKVS